MDKHFLIEDTGEEPKLLILDFQKNESKAFEQLVLNFKKKLSLYVYSKKKISFSDVNILSNLSEHFFDKIVEKINYCIIFPDFKKKNNLYSIVEKISNVCDKVLIIIPKENINNYLNEVSRIKKFPNVSICIVGEIFGSSYPNSFLTKKILDSVLKKTFIMPQNPLFPVYPISEDDFLNAIEYILFSKKSDKNLNFLLYYKDLENMTSLMHAIKRVEHELSVSYPNTNGKIINGYKPDGIYAENFNSASSDIYKVFTGFDKGVEKLIEEGSLKKTHSETRIVKKATKSLSGYLFVFISAFIIFISISICAMFLSIHFFKKGLEFLNEGNFNYAKKNIIYSNNLVKYTKPQIVFITNQIDFFSESQFAKYIETYSYAVDLADELVDSIEKSLKDPKNLSDQNVSAMFTNTFLLYFLIQSNNFSNDINLSRELNNYLPLLNIIKESLGFQKEMNYLVLFQNNNELRPTGGFIGSVADINVKKGKIKNYEVYDVYSLDGQLKEHVEPHFVIRRYLQPHLYLRDSNFNPDFQESASSAAMLYKLESGRVVDAVVAVDTQVLKTLIEIIGPVEIPGVKERITKDNVISIVQNIIHDNFFPGSNEKKDILNRLSSKIIIQLENDIEKKIKLLKKIPELFAKKHIQVSFNENFLQKGAIAAGISGSLTDLRIGDNLFRDTVSINEANIGVNKINEFISREVDYSAFLKETELISEIGVQYKNSGNDDYTMYFRAITPNDSLLEEILIDGILQKIVPAVTNPSFYERRGFQSPEGLEISEENLTSDLTSFGFRIVVPKKSSKRIKIIIKRPFFEIPHSFTYSLKYIKQAGTEPYPLTVTLQTGNKLKKQEDKNGNSPVIYDSKIYEDIELTSEIYKTK